MNDSKTYAIASCPEIMELSDEQKEWLKSRILETCCTTARRSLDGTKVIVKWRGPNPLEVLEITHTLHTYDEILEEVQNEEWKEDIL